MFAATKERLAGESGVARSAPPPAVVTPSSVPEASRVRVAGEHSSLIGFPPCGDIGHDWVVSSFGENLKLLSQALAHI